jgi:hypothetical protein
MKNSMLLIFLAIGGVIAYLFLSKRQPQAQGTNTILGSTGSSQPAVTQSKAGKQRTDNANSYLQAASSLLSSIIGKSGSSGGGGSSAGLQPGGAEKNISNLFGAFGSRASSNGPGVFTSVVYAGSGMPIANPNQYSAPAGPLFENPNQYSDPIGPLYSDTNQYDSPIGPSLELGNPFGDATSGN